MNNCLKSILSFLEKNKISPKKIDIAKLDDMYFVSSYNELSSQFISESVASGASYGKEEALIKSLVEHVERLLSKEHSKEFKANGLIRSDGFAAFPKYYESLNSISLCKNNSYHEAFERFCWATWWDNPNYSFEILDYKILTSEKNKKYCDFLINNFNLENIKVIIPRTDIEKFSKLFIFISKIKGGGYITGGAAGSFSEYTNTHTRAISELARHLLAYDKMKISNLNNLSFYERRLNNFASGLNNELVQNRLNNNLSLDIIKTPNLIFDSIFQHKFENDFVLSRSIFLNQPVFIGGDLNRLCL